MCCVTDIINQGIGVMLTGMGTVFSFLIVLWFSVSAMGKIVGKLNEIFPEPVPAAAKIPVKKSSDDTEIAIAIAAEFRRTKSGL